MLERFDLERPVTVGNFDAERAAGGERDHFVGRERPLGENAEHLTPHTAGRADHGDRVTHCLLSIPQGTRKSGSPSGGALLSENGAKHNAAAPHRRRHKVLPTSSRQFAIVPDESRVH